MKMTIDMADTHAMIMTRSKGMRKRWPAFSCNSKNWAITVPSQRDAAKPRQEFEFVVITHKATGLLASTASSLRAARMKAKRFDAIFGNARTSVGVNRKFKKLDAKTKIYVRGY